MKLFGKNTEKDLIVIAEVGVNHEGSITKAKELINLAKESGADAVKFQSYTPERYITAMDEERYKRVKKFSLNENDLIDLKKYAKNLNIPIFSTAVTEDWVEILSKHFDTIKIASGDLNFKPVIDLALKTNKKIILSVGGGNKDEIKRTIDWCKEYSRDISLEDRLVLMHCVAAYPVPIDEANILNMSWLKKTFGLVTGYSNHVIGANACLAAVALGAQVIEVHFTDNKRDRTFRDHALSFEPKDLSEFIKIAKDIKLSIGREVSFRPKSEINNLVAMRKGVIVKKNMKAGDIISEEDLLYSRPTSHGNINKPVHEIKEYLLGKTLQSDIKKYFPIKNEDVS
jgi:N,N'-diacetyllegionaminate synthase